MLNAANTPRLSKSDVLGPRPIPFMGSRGNLILFMRDPIGYLRMLHQRYGNFAAMAKGARRTIIFAFGPDQNQTILSQPDLFLNAGITHSGPDRSANQRIGFGLLSMNGDEHKRHRQLLAPAFHPKNFQGYFSKISEITEGMLNEWASRSVLDLSFEMGRLAKLISGSVLLGLNNPQDIFVVGALIERWRNANFSAARAFPFDIVGSPYRKMLKLAEQLEQMLKEIICKKKACLTSESNDVLSSLVRMSDKEGHGFSNEALIGHANLLFGASYETTSSALMWTFLLLSQHPDVSAHLMDELDALFDDRPSNAAVLDQAPFLEQVLQESLRILPPAVYSCRVASTEVALGPYLLPKGTTVGFSHFITHHMADLFSEPERFVPERWATTKSSPFAYLPFGYGAHVCLGASFAMMTMKIVVAMVLKRFRLAVVPDAKINRKVAITLGVKNGMPVHITPQDRQFFKSKTRIRGNIHEMVCLDS